MAVIKGRKADLCCRTAKNAQSMKEEVGLGRFRNWLAEGVWGLQMSGSVRVPGREATLFSIDCFSDVPERPKFYKERGQLPKILPSWAKDTAVFLLV